MTQQGVTPGQGPSDAEILARGATVPVGDLDTVFVRLIPVREYPTYRALLDSEPDLVAFVTGKDAAWVDNLRPADHEAILAAARRLNDGFFGAWLERRMEVARTLQPERAAFLEKAAEAFVRAAQAEGKPSASPSGPPASPSSSGGRITRSPVSP